MRVRRVKGESETLLELDSAVWRSAAFEDFGMVPTPLSGNPAIKKISGFLEKSTDHGVLTALRAAAVHNGERVAVRLAWKCPEKRDAIRDLDEFVDAVACMFPLAKSANAMTMGAPGAPVNAWYWRADHAAEPFDVIAEGYGTSERRSGTPTGLVSRGAYQDGEWRVVMSRLLASPDEQFVRFEPGSSAGIAFALWSGDNKERSARKSSSLTFTPLEIDP